MRTAVQSLRVKQVAEGLIPKGSSQVRELSPEASTTHIRSKCTRQAEPSDQMLSPKGNLFFSTHSIVHNAVIKTQK